MAPLPPPDPLPAFVYKITPTAPPDPIPERYPLSELDRQDGFVHLSTSWQIPITASLFFTHSPSIFLIKLRLSNFDPASVKWDEVDGTNGCPHLYGNFGPADVVGVLEVKRGEGEGWGEVFEKAEVRGWLE
ncbi:hypothetical protein C8A05DRAFT_34855 [Staphylotrichum tortipilum]|uniref:DUF952 domain-containing protein n=1 Tax=Staphylotrichum tortipilum TaxID=2831512 RepID=A0AAN6MJZ2_9PEZI|nr:hypothetical protein C8A05DRAFT_34855 [Staphylotrichum longicolle]